MSDGRSFGYWRVPVLNQLLLELLRSRVVKRQQRSADVIPRLVGVPVGENRLHRRDQRKGLDDLSAAGDRGLQVRRVGLLPIRIDVLDGRCIDVFGRGDAAGATCTQNVQQKRLRAGEHTQLRKVLDDGEGIVEVARAVF